MFQSDPKVQKFIKEACNGKDHIKLTIGIIADGEKSIKVFDKTGEIQNENYIYEIGSITKTFTASLLAKYVYEQKVALDDPVSKYIEGLKCEKYYPTLRRLATHTSGLGKYELFGNWEYLKLALGYVFSSGVINKGKMPYNLDLEKMRKLLNQSKLQDKDYPFRYSNFGFALIGYVIGVISGKGYWDTMDNFLSEELGLQQSYTGAYTGEKLQGFSKKNQPFGNWNWGKDLMAPGGDICSTAQDLLAYAHMNMYDEKPYFSLCHQKHADFENFGSGLSWGLQKKNNQVLSHGGATAMFTSTLVFDKSKKLASVVLSNYRIDTATLGFVVLEHMQEVYNS